MIPSPRANTGGVTQPALHFVGNRRSGDRFLSGRADAFRHRKYSSQIIAWMGRLLRKISVVVVKIANATAGGEGSPIRRRFLGRADDGRSLFRRKIRSDFARDDARFFVPGANSAA